jgi:FKBP-type peptidyl-prolyl cis-trans isomerase FkpA
MPLVLHHGSYQEVSRLTPSVANMRRLLRIASASAALLLAACSSDPVSVPEANPATTQFASTLNVDIAKMTRTASGLYYRDSVVGTNDATAAVGDSVTVRYTGWLSNGTQFDSNRGGGPAFGFRLGRGRVIEGWDEGLVGMRKGGRRILVIPPSLAYGPGGYLSIPGNAILVFDVELLQVN